MKTTILTTSLLTLNALTTQAAGASLQVFTHTASEAGFLVNSHLITGKKDAILVDAQFTKSEALKVVQLVKAKKKNLKTIFITHGHPDHYFGLEVLKKEFPKAQVLARPAVIASMVETFSGKQAYWKSVYKDEIADTLVKPEAFSGKHLSVDGQNIRLIDLEAGESDAATALFIENSQTLLAGDAVYSQVHLWLAEGRSDGWLKNIQLLKALKPVKVLAGHGTSGGADLLSKNEAYIQNYEKVATQVKTKEELISQMKALYPKEALPVILEIAAGAKKAQ